MRYCPSNPNYSSSPGRALDTHLERHDMSAAEFAQCTGRSVEFFLELVSGAVPSDSGTAKHIV